jgi:hypothetical protein
MKTYYDSVLKEENISLRFPWFKNWDGIQNLMASMADDLALGEWELHSSGYEMECQLQTPYQILGSRHYEQPEMVHPAGSVHAAPSLLATVLL